MFHRNAKPPTTALPNMDTIDDVMDHLLPAGWRRRLLQRTGI